MQPEEVFTIFTHHRLNEWDENHDGKKMWIVQVSRLKTGVKPSCRKKQAYMGNDHHDEDVGHIQSVYVQNGSLVNQNHLSDG
jgi:hypothetical protein